MPSPSPAAYPPKWRRATCTDALSRDQQFGLPTHVETIIDLPVCLRIEVYPPKRWKNTISRCRSGPEQGVIAYVGENGSPTI
jgi:hypothetical protein